MDVFELTPEETLVVVKDSLMKMTPEKRLEIILKIAEDFCLECGNAYSNDRGVCHCNNDE